MFQEIANVFLAISADGRVFVELSIHKDRNVDLRLITYYIPHMYKLNNSDAGNAYIKHIEGEKCFTNLL
jgi:hypothetical protein